MEILTNKEAQKRALKLKNRPLHEWLKGGRNRVLVNGEPCLLPGIEEMEKDIKRSQPVHIPSEIRPCNVHFPTSGKSPKRTANTSSPKNFFDYGQKNSYDESLIERVLEASENLSRNQIAERIVCPALNCGRTKAMEYIKEILE